MKLIDRRTDDGSRHFACLPKTADWETFRDHLAQLPDLRVTNFVPKGIVEPWIDFAYQGHQFVVREQRGEVWFFVDNPQCCDLLLYQVVLHSQGLLCKGERLSAKMILPLPGQTG